MNLFDQLVTEAIKNQPELSTLRVVIEKELLHHDILRTLSENDLLQHLTFIGGTCLRTCYGGVRLSEDLDFTGGKNFSRESLSTLGKTLTKSLKEKYGLQINVSAPVKESTNVDTWKIKIETRPEHKHLPAQRINIDICRLPSYDKKPMMLLNPYGVEMGTGGLIIQAQSREEIYTDKLLAFALRPNRIKYRDIWDIVWLHQQGFKPDLTLIGKKLKDRRISRDEFIAQFVEREMSLAKNSTPEVEFKKEMQRFLAPTQIKKTLTQKHWWTFIVNLMADLRKQLGENV